jgi:hypothetical protein
MAAVSLMFTQMRHQRVKVIAIAGLRSTHLDAKSKT